jgi:cytochrome b subunit of formate dehydrogenase
MGPFSTQSLAMTGAGALREPEGPFYQRVWFIVVVTVVLLLLIVGIVLLTLVIKYKVTHRASMPSTGKYHGKSLKQDLPQTFSFFS